MNVLEQLAAEWYMLQGYFVRTNLKFDKRAKGGWLGEMDVAALHPATRELVHLETSMDAAPWVQRRQRFQRKFSNAAAHLESTFSFPITTYRQIAIVGFSQVGQADAFGDGIEVRSVPEFVREIAERLRKDHPPSSLVPEHLPLIRTMQFTVHWGRPKTPKAQRRK